MEDIQQATLDLLAAGGMTSVQVLNEFANVARRKLGFDWAQIEDAVAAVCVLLPDPAPLQLQTHARALKIVDRFGVSFYDALVIATAVESNCAVLYTEDLQDGQRIEGTEVLNPFVESPVAVESVYEPFASLHFPQHVWLPPSKLVG